MIKLFSVLAVVTILGGCAAVTQTADDFLKAGDPDAKVDGNITKSDLNAVLVRSKEALDLYGGFGALPASVQTSVLLACSLSDALSTSLDDVDGR